MRCPSCQKRVAPFVKWFFWTGPKRTCVNCGSRLRYKGYYWAVGFHAALGAACAAFHVPFWIIFGIVLMTGVVYPWFFARYEPVV
jgi:hypothetical protein